MERIASLDGGLGAVATATGLGPQFITFAALAGAGDHIVASAQLYGGSLTQLDVTLRQFGVDTTFVTSADPFAYAEAITDRTKLVFAETVANPSGQIADISGLADVAHAAEVIRLVGKLAGIGAGSAQFSGSLTNTTTLADLKLN